MPAIGSFARHILSLWSHNWWAIFYFNFRMLPFRQAVRLPFHFSHRVRFERLSGKICLDIQNPRRAMIRIGARGSEMFPRLQTVLDIAGNLSFEGACEIGHGALLRIEPYGKVRFGRNVRLGAVTKLYAANLIEFDDEIDFSWECQIFDTNFHWTRDSINNFVPPRDGSISIGSRNWFGNRVTVMKGCKTGKNVIVASNSLCNKDYCHLGQEILLAGSPARLVRKGIYRLFEGVDIPFSGAATPK